MTIIVPRGAEAAAVRKAQPDGHVIEVPPGRRAAELLPPIDEDELVVVLGLCGALRTAKVGDVVVYRSVADDVGRMTLDPASCATLAASLGARTVAACTADHVVTTVAERTALAARYDADAVDMEGVFLARACAERGLRSAMVRVVSDDASRDLPALERAISADGRVDGLRIAAAFVRSPRAAFAFVRDVRVALRRLTEIAPTLSA